MLYILNAQITPFEGAQATFVERRIDVNEAKKIVNSQPFVSAVGHAATAQLLSKLLDASIPTNRTQVFLKPGDMALAIVLKSRIPEGVVLDEQAIRNIGFEIVVIERVS
ncbi:DNA binding protein [Acidianus rod-shaped virus 1]|uniref:DUF1874 domain-containing protein n=1 Tax=Acidianus rod-shaped virus 1 TaxID=309181 RepID=Q50I58_9VIRU|nr:DNA binding protein [Acidianus rod-shaped virus 1]CAI44168.1 hypothetical protein [Acidianus rod-shaped virus 1]